jgi:putative ABC transport system substrate-binding protein
MQSAGRGRWFFAAGGVLAGALAAGRVAAQGAAQPSRVALLLVGTRATESVTVDVFRDTMARLGHVEGRNLVLDLREADGRFERYPALLAEALGERPKVIVIRGSEAVHAAMKATRSVPIVAISPAIAARGPRYVE